MAPLNVIALISGGKDSFYAHLHTLALGHRVVALGNLYPPGSPNAEHDSTAEDLNSHMYQTAGFSLIPLYAKALETPLYRNPITGTAVRRGKDYAYSGTEDPASISTPDETEDLTTLLTDILNIHPEANALCSGAILSTYQRTRVESVCLRLGLTPLAWLWQYPLLPCPELSPDSLLRDIADAGLDARIVKVASGGLDDSFLWQSLADQTTRARIMKAVNRFGGSVLGEGGEFETIVIRGPAGVWKESLEVSPVDMVVVNGGGGEAMLGFIGGELALSFPDRSKDEDEDGDELMDKEVRWRQNFKFPNLWDKKFFELNHALPLLSTSRNVDLEMAGQRAAWVPKPVITLDRSMVRFSNLTAIDELHNAIEQMMNICQQMTQILERYGLTVDDAVFITILLRSMADFPVINKIYGSLFDKPNPPARATVACGSTLPKDCHVMLSGMAHRGSADTREGLHVQSRSYWAPANIGPYSQAISVPNPGSENDFNSDVPRTVYIAGQIPLVPSTMDPLQTTLFTNKANGGVSEDTFTPQALLSLQHLWRIGAATGVSWWTGAVVFLAAQPAGSGSSISVEVRAKRAWDIWSEMHRLPSPEETIDETDESGPDLWDRTYGGQGTLATGEDNLKPRGIPDWDCEKLPEMGKRRKPPGFFAVEVDELPRGCSIEWLASGWQVSRDGDPFHRVAVWEGSDISQNWRKSSPFASMQAGDHDKFELRQVEFKQNKDAEKARKWLEECELGADLHGADKAILPRRYNRYGKSDDSGEYWEHVVVYTTRPEVFVGLKVEIVPCRRVWGIRGKEVEAGFIHSRAQIPTIGGPPW